MDRARGALLFTRLAAASPMGQQLYEDRVIAGVKGALGIERPVREIVVRSLRSPLAGNARLPAVLLGEGPLWMRQAAGAVLAGRAGGLTHRLDLRVPQGRGPEVVTIHDLPPLRFRDEGVLPRDAARTARRAERVICPSAFAAQEVVDMLGVADPVVILNGVDRSWFDIGHQGSTTLSAGVTPPYVLHLGGATERKNLHALAAAWARLAPSWPEVSLVLCGPPDRRRDALFGPLERVVAVGRLSGTTLQAVVRSASAVVVPSTYEGFGLPALEAMAAGTPVVAADRGALPEVCGDAAVLVLKQAHSNEDGPQVPRGRAWRAKTAARTGPPGSPAVVYSASMGFL